MVPATDPSAAKTPPVTSTTGPAGAYAPSNGFPPMPMPSTFSHITDPRDARLNGRPRHQQVPAALVLALGLAVPTATQAGTPAEELATFKLADPALVIELVAAEPDVISPVAMTWDAGGRLFVAEMRDYPNARTGGTIRMLEDRDHDGRYETSVVFADGLPFPNSVVPWNGGVLVTAAPDLWFLKDTDGDGKADERRVLFTGFGTGNQQLRVNGLFWGIDGWVYGANGRSDGEIRRPGSEERWSLRGRDFRFQPDTGRFETLAGRCQFGHARDDWGNRFLSWNTIPVRHEVFPDEVLARSRELGAAGVLVDCLPPEDAGQVFPISPAPQVFNNESGAHFNALSGLHVYRGGALGPAYRGNAFVGESLRNLAHRRALVPDGPTFRAERTESGREFLAGADPWFHPVNFATGPDDALYVADFYRQFVEHPDWVARDTRDKVTWTVGAGSGRIWRIRSKTAARTVRVPTALTDTKPAGWVRALESANSWQRDTAARLLFERRSTDSATRKSLATIARKAKAPESRAQALQLLAALDSTTTGPNSSMAVLERAFADPDARVRAVAVRTVAARWPALHTLEPLARDPDERVRLEVALALAHPVRDRKAADDDNALAAKIAQSTTNRWVRLAAAAAVRPGPAPWLASALPTPPPGRPVPVPRGADPDRQKVVDAYQPALRLTPNRSRGAATFGQLCAGCHYMQGVGQRVGPDLSGIATRPVEVLLTDILDPSRQVAPDYATYEFILSGGESVTGLLASESATRVTVRHAGTPDESMARSQIRETRATGRSLMPDGLEQGLGPQDLADLLGFLREPDVKLIPAQP